MGEPFRYIRAALLTEYRVGIHLTRLDSIGSMFATLFVSMHNSQRELNPLKSSLAIRSRNHEAAITETITGKNNRQTFLIPISICVCVCVFTWVEQLGLLLSSVVVTKSHVMIKLVLYPHDLSSWHGHSIMILIKCLLFYFTISLNYARLVF